jgi:hypothetical protein
MAGSAQAQQRLKSLIVAAVLGLVPASCGGGNPDERGPDAKVHPPESVARAFQQQDLELVRMLDLPQGFGLETVFLPAVDKSDDPSYTVYVFDGVDSLNKFLEDGEKVPHSRPKHVGNIIEQDNVLVFERSDIPGDDAAAIDEALAVLKRDP